MNPKVCFSFVWGSLFASSWWMFFWFLPKSTKDEPYSLLIIPAIILTVTVVAAFLCSVCDNWDQG